MDSTIRFIRLTEDLILDEEKDMKLPKGLTIPIEVRKGDKHIKSEDITIPAIVSGMVQAITDGHEESAQYRKIVSMLFPDLEVSLTQTGIAKIHQHDPKGALPFFIHAYRYAPSPESAINLANCYREDAKEDEDSWLKSLHTIHEALDMFGENDKILRTAGDIASELGNFEDAASYYSRYLAVAAEGNEKDEVKRIVRKIESLLSMDQAFLEGYDAMMMGKPDVAVEKATAFIKESPSVWNGYFLRGWAKRVLGDADGARTDLLECIKLGRSDADIYSELSMAEHASGNKELALTYLETAADLDPSPAIMLNLASMYIESGMFDEAREYIERARFAKAPQSLLESVIKRYEGITGEALGDIVHEEIIPSDEEEAKEALEGLRGHHEHDCHSHECTCGHHHHEEEE